jgi:hypothetical protein
MDGLDNKDSNDKENDTKHAPAENNKETPEPAQEQKKEASTPADNSEETKSDDKPTSTRKLSSGTFVTPTATSTHHPTSVPNALGKLPLVGGLLGGAGGGL